MANNRRVKVNEGIFNAVKILVDKGGTLKEVASYFGLSTFTVGIIRDSENLDEYKNTLLARNNAIRAKKKKPETKEQPKEELKEQAAQVVEHRQTVTVQATHYMMQEMQKTNELLTLISRKLAFIVDELTGVKS